MLRSSDQPAFAKRDCQLVHLIVSNVRWLFEASLSTHTGAAEPELSPSRQRVLTLMLQGLPRREIAKRLHLSPHTVKDHTTAIYRHYQVNSHVELMRFFQTGRHGTAD